MGTCEIELAYGKGTIRFTMKRDSLLGILEPKTTTPADNPASLIEKALATPVGSAPLAELANRKSRIVIMTSDITRTTPSTLMLPPVLAQLETAGVASTNITIVFALGIHRRHTTEEQERLVGKDIFARYRCIDHDRTRTVDLGTTTSGTPMHIFDQVAEADMRICLGNIDPHYFAGYTGGAKAVMPGVSSEESIASTHRLMLVPEAVAGKREGNPARAMIDEVGRTVGIDFILNVVLNKEKQILHASAGDAIGAHQAGCKFADSYFKVGISQKADIVIVGAGGYPKDMNVYQAQKALDNAGYAVRRGGTIILVAECREGLGDPTFEQWVAEAQSPQDWVKRIEARFVLGGHKAGVIGMLLENANVILVSSLPAKTAKTLFFTPANTVEEALSLAFSHHGPDATCVLMPSGALTLPTLSDT